MHAEETIREMIRSHPDVRGTANDALVRCIEACWACAQACTACADACLGEDMVDQLRQCIRLDLDCADVCLATGALASRRTGANEAVLASQLGTCALACSACAAECERHAGHHAHCRVCAEACRACERACNDAVRTVAH
ncbi:four-helix bundle copper-binding protein [Rhodoplanes elegans]|uniref:Four-helix bundle copper-binding protein n=1 Tax=Rhodoplanes elegans TaxID=29408 RepID=A0A327KEG8_9BRAD|nr:four-helix bundle copper-binding protein [Rhodoplanes elegans]MBK5962050.1 four-helix bundle copper-binding protein [Rhodoplanes elegans]RAI36023.1 four-helix bundle copper-binding protein [Rhodoplanes elegans]